MNDLSPMSANEVCRVVAALEDLGLVNIDAVAIDAARSLVGVGQYSYPDIGVAVVDVAAHAVRWRVGWRITGSPAIAGLVFGRDGERLWVAHTEASLRCYATRDGTLVSAPGPEHALSGADVRLARDASYLLVRGSEDRSPGWSGGGVFETFSHLRAVEGPEPAADPDAIERAILATVPGDVPVERYNGNGVLAYSPDGKLELVSRDASQKVRVSRAEGPPAPPQLILRRRNDDAPLDTLTFHRAADFALSAGFADDGESFWVGTNTGRLFRYEIALPR
jgi:hypothetical protein